MAKVVKSILLIIAIVVAVKLTAATVTKPEDSSSVENSGYNLDLGLYSNLNEAIR